MKIDFKDYLTWVRIFAGVFLIVMYVSVIPTLKAWTWGFWSYEYFVMCGFLIIYIWWDNMTTTNRRLYRIESKLDAQQKDGE